MYLMDLSLALLKPTAKPPTFQLFQLYTTVFVKLHN